MLVNRKRIPLRESVFQLVFQEGTHSTENRIPALTATQRSNNLPNPTYHHVSFSQLIQDFQFVYFHLQNSNNFL